MENFHTLEEWLPWLDELADDNYIVIDDFLEEQLFHHIKTFFTDRLELFKQAGIGSLDNHQIKRNIRGDLTYWLDPGRDTELASYWSLLQETIDILNRYCFLSLSGAEFHLAHYPAGAFYEKHIDQFSERNNRIISMIIYLNDDWRKGDGGELEIITKEGNTVSIEPIARRCVMFKSSEVLHGVLEAHKSRYSLTGWLLYQPGKLGQLLG